MPTFHCPICGKKLKAGDEQIGATCKCTECDEVLRVPAPTGIVFLPNKSRPRNREPAAWRFAVSVIVMALGAAIGLPVVLSRNPPKEEQPAWDRSPEIQKKRAEFISALIATHVVADLKIREGFTTIVVHDDFLLLGFDDKRRVVDLIYCYLYADRSAFLDLVDYRNEKQVGTFSPKRGLSMD